jgi:hypothetical protein
MTDIHDIIKNWKTSKSKLYNNEFVDWELFHDECDCVGCWCTQAQVLFLVGGWTFEKLREEAVKGVGIDVQFARLLNISRAHSKLLYHVSYKEDDNPFLAITNPAKFLGKQWSKLLDFWWFLDTYAWDKNTIKRQTKHWDRVVEALSIIMKDDLAWDAAWYAIDYTPQLPNWRKFSEVAACATCEVQNYDSLIYKPFFLPMFGINTLNDIPPRPANYGNGIVPKGDANSCCNGGDI